MHGSKRLRRRRKVQYVGQGGPETAQGDSSADLASAEAVP
jgi:hypothetical protein